MRDKLDLKSVTRRVVTQPAAAGARSQADAERRALEQELEFAHVRREMRRALVAKLVEEYKTRPMQVRMRSLRSVLVERDESEEECDALQRAMERTLGERTIERLRRARQQKD